MSAPFIVTLDGPSGSGKTTIARRVALHLKLPCLDTGAMYRRVALEALQRGVSLSDEAGCCAIAQELQFQFRNDTGRLISEVRLPNGQIQALGAEIRSPEVSMAASTIAKMGLLRKIMVEQQQRLGRERGAVVEGRDAATVIFPDSPYKFYVTASSEERARRRFEELRSQSLTSQGERTDDSRSQGSVTFSYDEILKDLLARDHQDSSRAESPLVSAPGAMVIDTTGLSLDEVVARIIRSVEGPSRTLRPER